METTSYPKRASQLAVLLSIGLLSLSSIAVSQTAIPTITVRLANPAYDCSLGQYCLDVEFQANQPSTELFGMNVRFFYDDAFMELDSFADYQGGYGPILPNPPTVSMTLPGSGSAFGFPAPAIADFVNGAIQKVNLGAPAIYLETVGWTKLFKICFTVEGPIADSENFCPPVIWDLQLNPANGGYLPGDDGVVMTVVAPAPAISSPATENVAQFNWAYVGPGTSPYGAPRPADCISILCPVDLALTKTLNAGQEYPHPGDDIIFTIEVTNEGDLAAGEIRVIDYIPTGFTLNDMDWVPGILGSTGQSATAILSIANGLLPAGGLLPGQTASITITLNIDNDIPPGVYENFAEIYAVFDPVGNDLSQLDIDSDPDTDDTNDAPAEDDFDGANICLLGPPPIAGDLFVCQDDTVTYYAALYNPGYMYSFSLVNGGGIIYTTTDSSVTIIWNGPSGGPYELSLTETAYTGCEATSSIFVYIEGDGPLTCISHVNISINNGCGTKVLSGMILKGEQEGNNTYEVIIIDANGDTIPNAMLTWEHVGQTLKVSVVSVCTGQSCWGWITVEDKLGPIINCVCPQDGESERCDITCLQVNQILEGNIPKYLRPTVIDNCGDPTLDIVDVDLHFDPCAGGYVRVKWLATDASGNTSTCMQEFNIVPLNLESLQIPLDYNGECGDDSSPATTGWPQFLGEDITLIPGYCNIFVGYTDRKIQLCGQGIKIIRNWKIFDSCIPTQVDYFQTINLPDNTGPSFSCPNDITLSTEITSCYAHGYFARPEATDLCSGVSTYKLFSTGGIVTPQGNGYVISQLPIGKHTATWTITDACGNSSSCSFKITVADNVPPIVSCHQHTIVGLTSDRQDGLTIIPAEDFDDGSVDNCGEVTFRARRMESCIEFDWTTQGACLDEIPGGTPPVNSRDRGTVLRPCVPFTCCDIGQGPIMVELEVTDKAGNINYCMVEVEVQDKLAPAITLPADIIVSCELLFDIQEGTFRDADGNQNGALDEDPLSQLFGNLLDAARYTQADREQIMIDDPDNPNVPHPKNWGLDGLAQDNCEVDLSVQVRVSDDCTGNLPGDPPPGAVKLIERIFTANDGVQQTSRTQKIWVVNFTPYFINDTNANNEDPNDGVIWPPDASLTACTNDMALTGEPIILNSGCSMVMVNHKDTRLDVTDSGCFKIRREWSVLDWCQFNSNTGYGLWTYTQTIRVTDNDPVEILDEPTGPVTYCIEDPGISLPANNQAYLGENAPGASSCSVHVDLGLHVRESCSGVVTYDVKVFPYNGQEALQMVPPTVVPLDENNEAEIRFNTQTSGLPIINENGLPYNSDDCNEYHRVLWSVEDGCGNRTYVDYLFRLEDCKKPEPVGLQEISTVVMPPEGEVTISASSFNASSVDDCTPAVDLLFSFSLDQYQPTMTYTCDNVPILGAPFPVVIWVADGGADQNCNGQTEWTERNRKSFSAEIIITDNAGVCDNQGGILEGEVITEYTEAVGNVTVQLNMPGNTVREITTAQDGRFVFNHVPPGADYRIEPKRNDNYHNGVSTLDLVRIQKHLLGREVFTSPYQYIAADANNSQSVSALDLLEIRKLILGLQDEFPANQSWRFVKKGTQMAPGNPWPFNEQISIDNLPEEGGSGMDFVGVKIGDVNNSVQANAGQVIPRSGAKIVMVKVSGKVNLEAGEVAELRLTFPQVISGFQWTIETKGLEFEGLSSDDILINDQHVGIHQNGVLTMSWNGDCLDRSANQQGMSILLKFRVTHSGKLADMVSLSDKITPTEVYLEDEEVRGASLVFSYAGTNDDFILYRNRPNPWNDYTVIGFRLPVDAPAILTVFDLNGKVVKTISGNYSAGYNSVMLAADDIPSAGVYYYRLESAGYVASKKMVMVR